MANGFGGGFGGNMGGFTLPDFSQVDLSGIGAAVAKYQADEARKGATNQYEADVAEFKTNEAKGLEQGLGSLEQAPLPFDLEPQMIQEILPQLPPEIIPAVVPQLPPQIMPDIINGILPILPPEIIQQVIPQLPPEVLPEVIPQLPPDLVSAVDVSTVDEFIIPPGVEPDFVSAVEPDFLRIPPPLDREPQVIDEIAQIEKVDKSTPVKENPYEKVFIPQIPEFNPNDPTFIPKFDPTPPPEAPPPPPLPPIVPPEDPIVPPEDPIYVPGPDPIITPPPEDITLPVIPPPPEEYQPKEPMYTPREVIKNPSQGNLIDQQRRAYNSNLSNLVYQAPDIVRDEYVRPMSAAQFGSAPGSAEDVRTPVYKDPPQFIAMNRGGSINLNNSSMNRGIGQLPPMQQQDKLTQLFQSSFRPRR